VFKLVPVAVIAVLAPEFNEYNVDAVSKLFITPPILVDVRGTPIPECILLSVINSPSEVTNISFDTPEDVFPKETVSIEALIMLVSIPDLAEIVVCVIGVIPLPEYK
jgi:hypothetical protein